GFGCRVDVRGRNRGQRVTGLPPAPGPSGRSVILPYTRRMVQVAAAQKNEAARLIHAVADEFGRQTIRGSTIRHKSSPNVPAVPRDGERTGGCGRRSAGRVPLLRSNA